MDVAKTYRVRGQHQSRGLGHGQVAGRPAPLPEELTHQQQSPTWWHQFRGANQQVQHILKGLPGWGRTR